MNRDWPALIRNPGSVIDNKMTMGQHPGNRLIKGEGFHEAFRYDEIAKTDILQALAIDFT